MEWIGYLIGLCLMLGGGTGCGGYGGIGGWIGISVVLDLMLWSSVMYFSFNVSGG